MASYSTDDNVQNLVYGATNNDLDSATTAARDAATSIINSKLGLTSDLSTVPDVVTRCTTLLAAGIVSTGPSQNLSENVYYKAGLALLEQLGEEAVGESQDIYPSIHVEGFGRFETGNHDSIGWNN